MPQFSQRTFLPIVAAIGFSALGFFFLFGIFKSVYPQPDSEVTVQLTLTGKGNRPIAHAEVWLTRPAERLLGITRRNGKVKFKTLLPKGKIAVIEARGAAFRIAKEIPVPLLDEYSVDILLDPKSVESGLVKLESRTAAEIEQRAIAQFSTAMEKQLRDEREKDRIGIQVQLSPNQPPLSAAAQQFLAKVKNALEQEIHGKKIRNTKLRTLSIRLVRSNNHFLEMRLFDAKDSLIGAQLTATDKVTGGSLPGLLQNALTWKYDGGSWPSTSQNLANRFWQIRKRPLDEIQVYLDGEPLVSRSTHDLTTALLPESYSTGSIWQLAAVSQSGLMVLKELNTSQISRPLTWQWPEWLLSRK